MKGFGSMRRNLNILSPKSQFPEPEPNPKARRPVLNPNASPHANRLARSPRFPEIFEEDGDGSDPLEDEAHHQTSQEVAVFINFLPSPRDGTLILSASPPSSDCSNYPSQY